MLNGPSSRIPVQREIADAVRNTAEMIGAGIGGRMETAGGPIAHEVTAALANVAKARELPMYLGHEPNGNYLNRAHLLSGHHLTIGNLTPGQEAVRYTPKEGVSMAPADLGLLARSLYQDQEPANTPSDPKMFQYRLDRCSGGNCGYQG